MCNASNTPEMSLGRFRDEITRVKPMLLVRDEPLEPLSIVMPVDSVAVTLGASPCISLKFGAASVVLTHIQAVKPSVKGGTRSFRIVCSDYSASNVPVIVEYRLLCE